MSRYVFYDPKTGLLHPTVKVVPAKYLEQNIPEGFVALQSEVAEPSTHKVDLASGELVEELQTPPAPGYQWNISLRRWELTVDENRRQLALREIRRLESSQHRAMREVILGIPGGHERLQTLDAQIAELRKQLSLGGVTS